MTTLSSSPTPMQPVRGNAVFLLCECNTAWRIDQGTVAVFAVRVKDQMPVGPRKYLFSCSRGDWLFGHVASAGTFGFLTVGLEDSWLERIDLGSFESTESAGYEDFPSQIDGWVRRVESSMRFLPVAHAESAKVGNEITIAVGECLKAPIDSVLWSIALSGQIEYLSEVLDSSKGWVPLCGENSLKATTDASIRIAQCAEIRLVTELLLGVSHFHKLAFIQLERYGEEEATRNAQRLADRQRNQQSDTQEVLRELGSVLFPKSEIITGEDPLVAAMNVIGKQYNMTFHSQPGMGKNRSFDSEVEWLSRQSRVRVRHVVLRGSWWRSDSGPILARWSETGNPIALVRHEQTYYAIDPIAGTRRVVDREVAGQITREATTLIPPLPDNVDSLAALGKFAMRPVAPEILIVILLTTAVAMLGMLVPISTGFIIDEAIPDANLSQLYQLAAGLMAMAAAQAALSYSQKEAIQFARLAPAIKQRKPRSLFNHNSRRGQADRA